MHVLVSCILCDCNVLKRDNTKNAVNAKIRKFDNAECLKKVVGSIGRRAKK